MHLGSSRNFAASSLLPLHSMRFLFFSSAAFAGLHLKVLPVSAESFLTLSVKKKYGENTKVSFLLPNWNSKIGLAGLVWEAKQKVQPFYLKWLSYSPLCTSRAREVGRMGCERKRLQGKALQSLAHLKQQYDPLILYMHKVLLSWPSKVVLPMFVWSTCM